MPKKMRREYVLITANMVMCTLFCLPTSQFLVYVTCLMLIELIYCTEKMVIQDNCFHEVNCFFFFFFWFKNGFVD